MKILITGENGFIAKNLFNFYKNENDVIATSKEDSNNIYNKLEIFDPEIIFHCAAEIVDNAKMFDSNILLTYNILEYCKKSKNIKRLIIIGSSSEYGRKIKPMSEDDFLEPETIYEGTKAACTMLARSYSYTYNIPILVIRPFTIYGKYMKQTKFIQILFEKKQNNNRQLSLSNGVHDYVYIDDFIIAVDNIIKKNKNPFDIINVGSGVQKTNLELVKIFEETFDYTFDSIEKCQSKSYDSDVWVCDTSKLSKYYVCETDIKSGLKKMNE